MQVENQLLRMSGACSSVTFVTNVTNVTHRSHICHYQVFWMWLIQLERTTAPLQCRKSLNPNEYYISWHQLGARACLRRRSSVYLDNYSHPPVHQPNQSLQFLAFERGCQPDFDSRRKSNFCNSLRRGRWWLSNTLQTWPQICLLN